MPTAVLPPRRVPAVADLVATGRAAGLDAVGVTVAEPFSTTRRHLADRKAAGLHAGMRFTYLRPERSADPTAALPDARALVVGARSYRRTDGRTTGDGPAPPGCDGRTDGRTTGDGPAPPGRDRGTDGRTGGDGPAPPGRDRGTGGDGPAPPGGDRGTDGRTGGDGPAPPGCERPAGRVARYAWEDHYGPLEAALTAVARELKASGWRARVLADDNALVDREAAYRAGIGWYGKNANLLLPGTGSWFVLGSVVTDAPLVGGARPAPVPDGCGACTRCLDGCPTGAIVAPGVVDARRCLAWLLQVDGPFPAEHRVALGDRIYGCDDCQEVCPPNRRLDRGGAATAPVPAPAAGGDAQVSVDLLDLLAATDDELLARHGRWYIPGRQPRYLRRNALVVLGNVADGRDPRVVAALRRALFATDPLVRSHAVWAARRLGRADLVAGSGCRDDPDPLVRAEIAAAVEPR